MKRKHSTCLNCEQKLNKKANYCPNCGQENTDNQVGISVLIKELFTSLYSWDSRFGRTLKPFLFNPGKVTIEFIQGKRVKYANPIRWYFVISIFCFFFMTKVLNPSGQDEMKRIIESTKLSESTFDSLYNLPRSIDTTDILSEKRTSMVTHLMNTTDLSHEEILDSLKLNKLSWAEKFIVKKYMDFGTETQTSVMNYILRKIPLIIFFLIPLFAFLLYLFFRRKGLYFKHLIHSIHLHSFFFFLMGWLWLILLFYADFEDYGIIIVLITTFIYTLKSFKKVYQIKLLQSIIKLLMIFFIYTFFLFITLSIGIVISLALF